MQRLHTVVALSCCLWAGCSGVSDNGGSDGGDSDIRNPGSGNPGSGNSETGNSDSEPRISNEGGASTANSGQSNVAPDPLGFDKIGAVKGAGFEGTSFQIDVPTSWEQEDLADNQQTRLKAKRKTQIEEPAERTLQSDLEVENFVTNFAPDKFSEFVKKTAKNGSNLSERKVTLSNGVSAVFMSWELPSTERSPWRTLQYRLIAFDPDAPNWVWMVSGKLQARNDDDYAAPDGSAAESLVRCIKSFSF